MSLLDTVLEFEIIIDRTEKTESEKSPQPDIAIALLRLMGYVSELAFCATWHTGFEYSLWSVVKHPVKDSSPDRTSLIGQEYLDRNLIEAIQLLSKSANGWWIWDDDAEWGHKFVPLDEWKQHYADKVGEAEKQG